MLCPSRNFHSLTKGNTMAEELVSAAIQQLGAVEQKIEDVAVAEDQAAAAALFKDTFDLTISSRCGMALIAQDQGRPVDKEHGWEDDVLQMLGKGLDAAQKDHCLNAILADHQRATDLLSTLHPYVNYLHDIGFTK